VEVSVSKCYGLILDVDGVIADTETVNARASIQVFADLFGTGVRREDFEAGVGRGAEAYMNAAAVANGLNLADEQLAQAVAARQDYFLRDLSRSPLPAFPGVLELIEAALTRGDFSVAIATSSTRVKSGAVLKSARVPVDRMEYVCGDDVSRKKPEPDLFLTAAKRIGLVPACCVVVEDAPNGVRAAHAAGCKCIAVTNTTTGEKLGAADRIVGSLAEVRIEDVAAMLG
jgi:HAD superfamily hydrolase (TIGR01509 family)